MSPKGSFNYPTTYRIGAGLRAQLPQACAELQMTAPLVVTDPGVRALQWFEPLLAALKAVMPRATVFSEVEGNPTGRNVAVGCEAFAAGGHDGVLAIGGGSALDVGKCVALVQRNPGDVFAYEDIGDNYKRADPALIWPILAVPTTAGTGSEVGRAAVIVDERDHSKKIIFHAKMQPRLVVADPELTVGLPPALTAATGMDALAHCFEALCVPSYHPMADGIAIEGLRLIHENLELAVREGTNLVARTHMLMASAMGATAFQKGLGLVHALSHPLGGMTGLRHGTANAIFLPYVMVYNRNEIGGAMDRLARYLALPGAEKSGFDAVLSWLLALRNSLGIAHTLADVPRLDDTLAATIAQASVHDPSMGGNPRACNAEQALQVLNAARTGRLG